MNAYIIRNSEQSIKKETVKNASKSIAVCILACFLMFLFQLFAGLFMKPIEDEVLGLVVDIAMYIIYIGVPFFLAKLILKNISKKDSFAPPKRLTPKNPVLYIFGAVGAGYLINLTVNLLFQDFIEKFSVETVTSPESPLGIALFYLQVAIIPAIMEEWAFRGVLLRYLLPYGKSGAILISSLLFGMAHLDLPRIIFATFFGMFLAICYEYTNSLLVPMIIHFINNFISVTVTIFMDDPTFVVISGLAIMAFIGVGIGAIIYYSIKGLKKKQISLIKPSIIGYKLSLAKYTVKFFTNPAIIPYAAIFAFYLYLIYS